MTQPLTNVIDWLLRHSKDIDTTPLPTIDAWKALFDLHSTGWELPIDRALIGGFLADRLGYAFAAGYQAALRRLVPILPLLPFAALCVTEQGGGHPRNIQTTLTALEDGAWWLSGEKTFVTHAAEARLLLIAASTGINAAGRSQIRLALVDAHDPGVTLTPLPTLSFVPEVSHGKVTLDRVLVHAPNVLDGDGYYRYIKPFRTVEDTHVFGAMLAYLLRLACLFGWRDPVKAQLIGLLSTVHTLARGEAHASAVHLALEGLILQVRALLAQLDWSVVDGETRARWERDLPLLSIAETARAARFNNALHVYGLGGSAAEG